MTFYSTKVLSASGVSDGRIELLAPVSGQNVVLGSINLNFGITGVGVTGMATVFAVTGSNELHGDILYQWQSFDKTASFHTPGIVSTGGSKTIPQGLVLEIDNSANLNASYVVTCGYRDATKY